MISREYNIHYRDCVGSLVYILSTRVDLYFAVHKLAKCSSNSGKYNFEGLVHLLRYIGDNKNLVLKYYAKIEDEPLSDLLRQSIIKYENQLMVYSDFIWKDFPDTGRSTGFCIVLYQGRTIDHCKHVPGPVSQSSDESCYN